jgi:translation elongation factor EF-Tu-like GTPase
MRITDVFFIQLQGRGTVVTGHLDGEGLLRVGDVVVHSGRAHRIRGIEIFHKMLRESHGGMNLGLILGPEVPPRGFEGHMVSFRRG